MKTKLTGIFFLLILLCFLPAESANRVIRINQLGYLLGSVKVAVFLSYVPVEIKNFTLNDGLTGNEVYRGKAIPRNGTEWGMVTACRLNFSAYQGEGGYYIKAGGVQSPKFRIGNDVYEG